MYKYLFQWPKDRENGWSNELNGVCHDENNWFFTQDGKLWKFPVSHSVKEKVTSADPSRGIYKNSYGGHLGDLDYYGGYLFVPVTDDGTPYIAVFRASDLTYVTRQYILNNGSARQNNGAYEPTTYFHPYRTIPWCAVNPCNGKLYTTDKEKSGSCVSKDLFVYDIDLDKIRQGSQEFLHFHCTIRMYDERCRRLTLIHMQGGCFDNQNHLHVNNGFWKKKEANSKGGISVFSVPVATAEGGIYGIRRIIKSNQSRGFRYQFNSYGEEPEGLTYWDLNDGRAPGIKGVLHAIMLDNAGTGADDFYFKHYDRI